MDDRFRHLIDSLSGPLFVIDREWRITYANPAWLRLVATRSDEVLGRTCAEALHWVGDLCSPILCPIPHLFETHEPTHFVCPVYQQLSAPGSVEISSSPVFNTEGQIQEIALTIHSKESSSTGSQPEWLPDPLARVARSDADCITMLVPGIESILDSILDHLRLVVDYDSASVCLADDKGWHLIASRGLPSEIDADNLIFSYDDAKIAQLEQTRQPIIIDDVQADERWLPIPGADYIRAWIGAPLLVQNRMIGTFNLDKRQAGAFTARDAQLVMAFANQAAATLENARLYQQVSRHLEEVSLLHRVALAATSSLDFGQVLRRCVKALMGIRNIEHVHVLLVDEAKGDLWLHPSVADLFSPRGGFRIPLGKGIMGWVAQTGQPLRVDDVRHEPRYLPGYPDTLSEMTIPLQVGGRVSGVLDVQSSKLGAFSEDDLRLLTTLASQLSTILHNIRLFEETRQRVRELTSLTQVSQALNQAQNLQTILDIVLEESIHLTDSTEGSIILIDPPGSQRLKMVAERGLSPEIMEAFNNRPVYAHEGTYRRALTSGQIVEVKDTTSDPEFLTDVGSKARQITNIPLLTDRSAIGLIAVDRLPNDDSTRRLLTALASMAALAIDKEQLHQETANQLAEASTLYTLATQITSSLSQYMVLSSIVSILRLTLDCRACSIFLIEPSHEYLRLEAASGPSVSWKGVARLKIGEGISGQVIERRQPIYVPDTTLEKDFLYFDPDIRSLFVVPLIVRDEIVGTLSIDSTKPNAFDNERRLLTIAAAQAAVAIENAQLYESLQQSYQDLENAYNEMRELDRMKSEFVQNISHELRTPLTFIKGYVELLQDGDMGPLNQEQAKALEIVSAKASALSQLVDDIISLQQTNHERMRLEPISLAQTGHEAVQAAQAAAAEAGLSLIDEIGSDLSPVLADKQRITQVFDNLLGNAIKFSNSGGTITVRMYEKDAVIHTEVQDTGIGIAEDKLDRIFDRFYQVDGTTTRRFGGTGLGLAIAKQIVEAHGGQVGVESTPNLGSRFYFTIPVSTVGSQLKGGT